MQNHIRHRTVLITGASSGFGRQLALDLTRHEVDLILAARSLDRLETLREELVQRTDCLVEIHALDVRDRCTVETTLADILSRHNIHILINNAGLALGMAPIDQGNPDHWDTMIDTNLKGLLYVSRPVIAQMRRLDSAHVVNIGSMAGRMPYPGGNAYCASKAAVHALGEAMNTDLLGTNVKVSTIAPGAADTNFSPTRFEGDREKARAVYEGYKPLSAADISQAILCVINTPPHVNIQYLDIMPTAQRNPYLLHRDA
jgi:NADP-dependent 3-hydroxy acid dehydrogenase YdfG